MSDVSLSLDSDFDDFDYFLADSSAGASLFSSYSVMLLLAVFGSSYNDSLLRGVGFSLVAYFWVLRAFLLVD